MVSPYNLIADKTQKPIQHYQYNGIISLFSSGRLTSVHDLQPEVRLKFVGFDAQIQTLLLLFGDPLFDGTYFPESEKIEESEFISS